MTGSARRWSRFTLLSVLATSAVLIVAPIYATASCEWVDGGPEVCTTGRESLIEHEGFGAVAILAIPVALAAAPVVFPRRALAIAVAVVLSALTLLGAASIGLFFLPAAALSWLTVANSSRGTAD
jgi:hypothetical protein